MFFFNVNFDGFSDFVPQVEMELSKSVICSLSGDKPFRLGTELKRLNYEFTRKERESLVFGSIMFLFSLCSSRLWDHQKTWQNSLMHDLKRNFNELSWGHRDSSFHFTFSDLNRSPTGERIWVSI